MTREDLPSRIPWPPAIYVTAVLAAVVLGTRYPLVGMFPAWATYVGFSTMALGLGVDGAAMLTMRRHRANILPHRAATALVVTGPFSRSRNPIYLGNTVMLAGAAAAFGNPWFAAMVPLAIAAVTTLAVEPEERHLAKRFGVAWEGYASRVPRWIKVSH